MAVPREEVRRIAALAGVRLDDAEEERLAGELSRILDYIRVIEPVELPEGTGALPSGRAEPPDSALAADSLDAGGPTLAAGPLEAAAAALSPLPLEAGALEAMAPDFREGLFTVPRLPGMEGGGGKEEAR